MRTSQQLWISISINRDGQVHINEDICLEFYFLGGIKYENLKIFLHFLLENVSFKDFIQFRTGSWRRCNVIIIIIILIIIITIKITLIFM